VPPGASSCAAPRRICRLPRHRPPARHGTARRRLRAGA
jgi:hypothetical protein